MNSKQSAPWFVGLGLLALFLLALFVRVYPVIAHPEKARGGLGPHMDSMLYHTLGYNLSQGKGFSRSNFFKTLDVRLAASDEDLQPGFTRGPIYPLFIAAVYKFFTDPQDMNVLDNWHKVWDRLRLAQCVLDASVCILVFSIARLLCPHGYWPAFVAAALYAFSWYNIFYTRNLLSESVATFCVTLMMWSLIAWIQRPKLLSIIFAAFASALVVLGRTEYLLFVPLMALGFVTHMRMDIKKALTGSFLYVILVSLFMAPWAIRNYTVFQKPILVSVGGVGQGFYDATWFNRRNWVEWGRAPASIFIDKEEQDQWQVIKMKYAKTLQSGSLEEVEELEREYIRMGLKRIRKKPVATMMNWMRKIPRLWYQDYIRLYRDVEASGVFFILYFVFAVYAYLKTDNTAQSLMWPIGLLFIYLTVIFIPFWVEPRYGVAFMPSLISLAGIGLTLFIQRRFQKAA